MFVCGIFNPEVYCPALKELPHTSLMSTGYLYGSNITYICDPGYQFDALSSGNLHTFTCSAAGQWISATLEDVDLSDVAMGCQGKTILNLAYVGLLLHFKILLMTNISCIFMMVCSAVHCPVAPRVANAYISTSDTAYKTTVTYTCINSHSFPDRRAQKHIVCDSTGQWHGVQRLGNCAGQ